MPSFGSQNQTIKKTPAGYIDSAFLDGNDGSDVAPSWNIAGFPDLTQLVVGTAFSVDLSAFLTDPGSPTTQIGLHSVSGQDARAAGFTISGTVLSNPNALATSGIFQLVGVRKTVSVLSPPISFSITAPAGVDNVAPTVPTGITAVPGTTPNTIVLSFDPPCDIAPGNATASGTASVSVYVNNALASPPSPIVTPANALPAPSNINLGSMSAPFLVSQSGKAWSVSAEGTAFVGTTTEQAGLIDFGTYSGAQNFIAKIDSYAASGATSALVGIMLHETAVAGGKFIAVGLGPSNGSTGLYVIERSIAGASSSQVATQPNDSDGHAIVGPVYLKISRSSDLQSVTFAYSLNENNWIQFYTTTLAMNAAVHYAGFCASQTASAYAPGVIEEIAISNSPRQSVTLTFGSSAQVNLQLLSTDKANNASALSTILVGTPSTQQQQQRTKKWNPAYGMGSNTHIIDPAGGTNLSTALNVEVKALLASGPAAVHYMIRIAWPAWETALGTFNYSLLNQIYTAVTGISQASDNPSKWTGKRLSIMLDCTLITSNGANVVPQYIYMDPGTYGSCPDGIHGGFWTNTALGNPNTAAALWRSAVMNRYIAAFTAFASAPMPSGFTLDNDPYVEIIFFPEVTSFTITPSAPDYSFTNLQTQIKGMLATIPPSFPHTNLGIQNNYFSTPALTCDLNTTIFANQWGISSPDLFGLNAVLNLQGEGTGPGIDGTITWGYRGYMGSTAANAHVAGEYAPSYNPIPNGIPPSLGIVPCFVDVQEPELDGVQFTSYGSAWAPGDIGNNADQTLHASHVFFCYLSGNSPVVLDSNLRNIGTPKGNWVGQVLPWISQNPIKWTTYPTGYP